MSMFPPEPDSETEFSAAIELAHEDPYDGELTSVIQLPEAPYMLSIQSASLDQSANPPPSSVLSPQPMRYPQLAPLLSISIPSGNEIPALESTSSSPASSSSQSTPLLGYQSGMYDPNFVTGEFGYDRYAFTFIVVVFRLILTRELPIDLSSKHTASLVHILNSIRLLWYYRWAVHSTRALTRSTPWRAVDNIS